MISVKELLQKQKMDGKNTTENYLNDKAELYNKRSGNLEGYDCKKCHNKGYLIIIQDGYEYMKECECMEIRRGKWRLESSGLADMVGRYHFDTYEAKTNLQKTTKRMAEEFVERGNGWFFIGGQVGSGKTHICTAICNKFMEQGKSVRYMIWTDEITKLKANKMDDEAYEKEISRWKRSDVLYIDDLFKTRNGSRPTDADVNIAFEIINARYNDNDLITIISGENTMSEILDIDEALGSRIFQRCGDFKLSIAKKRENNYRLRNEKE